MTDFDVERGVIIGPSRPGQGASALSRLNTWVIASLPERVKKNTVMVLFGTHDSGHNVLQSNTVAVPLGMSD